MLVLRAIRRNPVGAILILAAIIIAAGIIVDRDTHQFTLQTAVGQTNDTDDTDRAFEASEDFLQLERANRAFIDLVARTRPAVVQITTKTEILRGITRQRERLSPEREEFFREIFPDDLFRRFFEEREIPRNGERLPFESTGIGSGVIITDDGYILTNHHVIARATEIKVTLADGRVYEAELVGSDPASGNGGGSDLAVVKIEAEDLPTLAFGDSDALEVGEWVIAIGTPLNFSQTVTRGIVSAKDRDEFANIPFGNFIQTDAPINRGNSGGALINIRGELVGINTMIVGGGGFGIGNMGNIGLGFAIPSNTARTNVTQLIENGEVQRGWLGVEMRRVTDPDFAEKLKLDAPRGVLVQKVVMDSPAEKAGIQRGDVIIAVDGKDIRDGSHLMQVVAAAGVGTPTEVVVLRRGGEEKRFVVKLGKRTEEVTAAPGARREMDVPPAESEKETETFAGIRVKNLTPAIAERYGYASDEKGVVVTTVAPDSDAARKGIQPGSLIQEMEWTPVGNLEAYSGVVAEILADKRNQVLLYVKSPNEQGDGYVTLRVVAASGPVE